MHKSTVHTISSFVLTCIELFYSYFYLYDNLSGQPNYFHVSRMKNNIVGMETNMEQLLEKVFGIDSFWFLTNRTLRIKTIVLYQK